VSSCGIATDACRRLMQDATVADMSSMEALLGLLSKQDRIPSAIVASMWEIFGMCFQLAKVDIISTSITH